MSKPKTFFFLFLPFLNLPLQAQGMEVTDSLSIRIEEEFRWGVVSFHEGLYNKSILSLEKALALDPNNDLIRFWLGRSYYQSGFEEAGLNEWSSLKDRGVASSALLNFINIIEDRSGLAPELRTDGRLVELFEVPRQRDNYVYYNRPISLASSPEGDGSTYLLSYLTGNLSRISANGEIQRVFSGGVLGFNRPWDLAFLPDGKMIVSEYGEDRLSITNSFGLLTATIGSKGVGPGELLGPQFLTISDDSYVYVSEWGNRRVSKFSLEGEFILSFGEPRSDFSGLKGPSGLALREGLLYVSDSQKGRVEVFDESGNFIRTLIYEGLNAPEDILFSSDTTLLIADRDSIKAYDLKDETLYVASDLSGQARRVISLVQDENGNIISADFDKNTVSIMTDLRSLYAGLFIRIIRVDSSFYPDVYIDLTVEDRWGRPVVGLETKNFFVTEENRLIEGREVTYRGFQNDSISLAMVVDKNTRIEERKDVIQEALQNLFYQGFGPDDEAYFVGALEESPQLLGKPGDPFLPALERFSQDWSEKTEIATAIRQGASFLVASRKRKALSFISDGRIAPDAFKSYGLQDLTQYMKNNGIRFYPIYLEPNIRSPELDYMASETGGLSQYLFQPQGITPIIEHIRSATNGFYTLRYSSAAYSDFGRRYIPLAVEVEYIQKSGRDEMGFFAPLSF